MNEPIWLSSSIAATIHDAQISEHGGSPGIRDEGLIESALARAKNKWSREGDVDLADLAAAYASGLVKNHGFVDGNKRVGFMAAYTFLGLNGYDLDAPETEVVVMVRDLAASTLTERDFAAWIRQRWRVQRS